MEHENNVWNLFKVNDTVKTPERTAGNCHKRVIVSVLFVEWLRHSAKYLINLKNTFQIYGIDREEKSKFAIFLSSARQCIVSIIIIIIIIIIITVVVIIIISFFKVDFYITFYNYKKLINVILPRKLEKTLDTRRFTNSLM